MASRLSSGTPSHLGVFSLSKHAERTSATAHGRPSFSFDRLSPVLKILLCFLLNCFIYLCLVPTRAPKVRIYDETTKHEIATLQGGSGYGTSSAPGHSNRVFALKFHPDDPEVGKPSAPSWHFFITSSCHNDREFWSTPSLSLSSIPTKRERRLHIPECHTEIEYLVQVRCTPSIYFLRRFFIHRCFLREAGTTPSSSGTCAWGIP